MLVCDVACRVKETPDYLASTWKVANGFAVSDETVSGHGYLIEATPELSVQVSVDANDEFAAATEHSDGIICLFAQPTSTEPPATIRWCYQIALQQKV